MAAVRREERCRTQMRCNDGRCRLRNGRTTAQTVSLVPGWRADWAVGGPPQQARRHPGRHRHDATPNGRDLTRFYYPPLVELEPAIAPPNAPGLWSVVFAVETVDDTIARLLAHRGEPTVRWHRLGQVRPLLRARPLRKILVALVEELF